MDIKEILNKAFNLGQTYWQQADSEHASQHRKADLTLNKFNELSLAVEMDITIAKFQMDEIEKQRKNLLEELEGVLNCGRGISGPARLGHRHGRRQYVWAGDSVRGGIAACQRWRRQHGRRR